MTVTGIDRVRAAIDLDFIDRVPVDPRIITHAQTLTGIPLGRLWKDFDLIDMSIEKSFKEYGDYDIIPGTMTIMTEYSSAVTPFRAKLPGTGDWPEDREPQILDEEILTEHDYEKIIQRGFLRHFMSIIGSSKDFETRVPKIVLRLISRLPPGPFMAVTKAATRKEFKKMRPYHEKWMARGKFCYAGAMPPPPFETYMLLRSVNKGMIDLVERPEKVKAATRVLLRESIEFSINNVKASGINTVMIGGAHASNTYISPRMYEEFDLPYTLEFVNAFIEAGLTPVLHYDANWTMNLPLMRAFPKKKCILHLDGFTDIRKAKEILGDRICIMGDIPPHLMVTGSKDDVADYCRALIRDVGKGGGFILACGCECPMNAKPENVKTMIEVAHEDGRYIS